MKKLGIKLGITALALMMAMVFSGCGDTIHNHTIQGDQELYTPGIFTGEAPGRWGMITAEVSFSRNAITGIRMDAPYELGFFETPLERVPQQIVAFQTLDVEAVSGATLTSEAVVAAVEEAAKQASITGSVDHLWMTSVRTPNNNQVVQMTVEMVIVGAGAAGQSAAIAAGEVARDRGLDQIVLLEKLSHAGGSGYFFGTVAINNNTEISPWHRPLVTEARADVATQLQDILHDGNMPSGTGVDQAIFDRWRTVALADFNAHPSNRVFDSMAWAIIQNPTPANETQRIVMADFLRILDRAGMRWAPATWGFLAPAANWYRQTVSLDQTRSTASHMMTLLQGYIRRANLPITLKLETPAISLIEENDRVVGVVAQHVHGRRYYIRANHVVLTTGGFAACFDMVDRWLGANSPTRPQPWWTRENHRSNHGPGNTGDGINMALALNRPAQIGTMGAGLMTLGCPVTGMIADTIGPGGVNNNLGMFVCRNGQRFMNEMATAADNLQRFFDLPHHNNGALPYFLITSLHDNSQLLERNGVWYNTQNFPALSPSRLRAGQVFKADTLPELAAQIGVPADALVASAALWNSHVDFNAPGVDGGVACPFGRTAFMPGTAARPIANPRMINGPFLALPRAVTIHNTNNGLVVDANTRNVLRNDDGSIIPGLFAFGQNSNTAGGIGGNNQHSQGIWFIRVLYGLD